LSQTACAQISVQGVFPAGNSDCFVREGPNLRKIQQPMGRLRYARRQILRGLRPLTSGRLNNEGSLLGSPMSCRPALMSTFRVCRARGSFYW